MKKIKNFSKLQKSQRRKLKRFLNTLKRQESDFHYKKDKNSQISIWEQLGYSSVPVPNNFSLVNNPEEMIVFLGKVKNKIYSGWNIFLDFSKIKKVTNDGLIALLSVIQDKRTPYRANVYAIKPKNQALRKRLQESGVSEESTGLKSIAPPKFGRIRQKSGMMADTEEANELIQFATRQIFGQRRTLKDVQRILGECIDNTTFHANPKKRLAERWWGTVFCDEKKRIAYFSILDNGVGVIESLQVEWTRQIELFVKYDNNADLMRAIFEVGILSSTGESNRGNGLTGIFRARQRKQFSRLIVITNNVYVDFDNDQYRLLKNSFSGTFFYWEVKNGNDNSSGN